MNNSPSTTDSDKEPTVYRWGSFSITFQGKRASLKNHRFGPAPTKIGAKRKPISWFSFAARRRLLRKIAVWDFNAIGRSLFVTLTYPDEIPLPDQITRNKQRYIFHRHFEQYYNMHIPAIWRIEWERRKSGANIGQVYPHWHMLMLGPRFIAYQHINDYWRKVIGCEGYCRTEIQGAYGQHTAPMYIGKYMGKIQCTLSLVYGAYHNITGRHWGILRDKEIPICEATEHVDLAEDEKKLCLDFGREYFDEFPEDGCQSFTILGKAAEELREQFYKLRLAKPLGA